jgi:hypothetical protein
MTRSSLLLPAFNGTESEGRRGTDLRYSDEEFEEGLRLICTASSLSDCVLDV